MRCRWRRPTACCISAVVISAWGLAATLGDSRLADAVMQQDTGAVSSLLKQHVDVNARQTDGSTALLWAAHYDNRELAQMLIAAGADPRIANRYNISPISEAATNGDAAMIEMLLKAGANPNTTKEEGETVLMTAARTGKIDAVKALLDHGAKVNVTEDWRWQTPLMWSAAEGHPEVVQLLIDRGADVNARSAVFDYRDLKAKAGSVPMNFPRGGFTALLFAARQGNMEAAKVLLNAGANVNQGDPDNTSPLIVAIINLHYDLAGYLMDHGADINAADAKGRTPLYAAVDMRNMDITTRPTPKIPDKLDSLDIIKMLLAKGANPNAPLKSMLPPRGVLDGGDFTMSAGATPFLRAARSDDVTVMRMLLEKGADPKLETKAKDNALMLAAGISWRDGKTRGTEPDAVQAIQICLDHGLDVNAANSKGETALHGAASRGADKIVQFLADKGAKLDVKDKEGHTPLDTAMGVGASVGGVRAPHETTVALLRKLMGRGAEKTAQNDTPAAQ
jgi:uncharacterized protein